MSNKKKTVQVEKDGVFAEATRESFKGLVLRGWTPVEKSDKEAEKAAKAEAEAVEEAEKQVEEIFGPVDATLHDDTTPKEKN